MPLKKPRIRLLLLSAAAYASFACADGPWPATAALAPGLPSTTTLGSVLFNTDSARIDQALWPLLHSAAALARSHPSVVIELDGYADVRGSRNHNLTLSARRVESVVAFLTRLGVDPARIKAHIHGETRASANVRDRDGQVFDRRVSIILTTNPESA